MIGLGSNRLTVCRRGGMRVTQAGRGGMEWLAGGRLPSWASPYSAQATAALLAQFPTQWPTIRDYGFAHPEIVGYMNAYAPEDAKIAYSLVPLDKIRKLESTGGAYIETDLMANIDKLSFECVADIVGGFSTYPHALFAVANSISQGNNLYGILWAQNTDKLGFCLGSYSSQCIASGISNNTNNVKFEGIVGDTTFELKVNGESKGSKTKGTAASRTIWLFKMHGDRTSGEMGYKQSHISYVRFYTPSGDKGWFVPFIRGGENGMLDLVSGNFKTNAGSGSFTISETPSS